MMDRRTLSLGIILTALGVFFLLRHTINFSGPGPLLLFLGALLLTLSALRSFRGPVLPGGVLLGLGAGFLLQPVLEPWLPRWGSLVLGLGVGFLLVASLDRAAGRGRSPAPLVPGAILVVVAAAAALAKAVRLEVLLPALTRLWPWLLVAAGVALVATSLRRRTRRA